MEISIFDECIEVGGYITLQLKKNNDICYAEYEIADMDIQQEYYAGDKECGCYFSRGYSIESVDVYLGDSTYEIKGQQGVTTRNDVLQFCEMTEAEFVAYEKELQEIAEEYIEDCVKENPDDYICE